MEFAAGGATVGLYQTTWVSSPLEEEEEEEEEVEDKEERRVV